MSQFRLTIIPALELSKQSMSLNFSTESGLLGATSSCAELLLFLQGAAIKAMPDYSNVFIAERFVDGEWEEFDI